MANLLAPQRLESVQRSKPSLDGSIRLRLTYGKHEQVERTPTASIVGLRSSQTNTQPDCIARRSSILSRLDTKGRIPKETAWKITLQSAVDRTRMPLQVAGCIVFTMRRLEDEWVYGSEGWRLQLRQVGCAIRSGKNKDVICSTGADVVCSGWRATTVAARSDT